MPHTFLRGPQHNTFQTRLIPAALCPVETIPLTLPVAISCILHFTDITHQVESRSLFTQWCFSTSTYLARLALTQP